MATRFGPWDVQRLEAWVSATTVHDDDSAARHAHAVGPYRGRVTHDGDGGDGGDGAGGGGGTGGDGWGGGRDEWGGGGDGDATAATRNALAAIVTACEGPHATANRQAVGDTAGVFTAVAASMAKHVGDAGVQMEGMKALRALVLNHPVNQKRVGDTAGVVDAVAAGMKAHHRSAAVHMEGMEVLRATASTRASRATAAAVATMDAHVGDARVQMEGMRHRRRGCRPGCARG